MGGAAIGSAVPVFGTAVGAAAGALVLGIAGAFVGDKLTEWIVDVTIAEE